MTNRVPANSSSSSAAGFPSSIISRPSFFQCHTASPSQQDLTSSTQQITLGEHFQRLPTMAGQPL